MSERRSRLGPQHRFWDNDLPLRESPVLGVGSLYDAALSQSSDELEFSRATNIMRGALLAVFFLIAAMSFSAVYFGLTPILVGLFVEEPLLGVLLLVPLSFIFGIAVQSPRLDLTMPRETPVRFVRRTKMIRSYEFQWTWNPFARWPTVIKEFDWANVQAEIQKQAGFNGKAYIVRYALVLCVCKPGTFEVIDRITLLSNRILTKDLEHIWNYLRRYMTEGPDNLPPVELLPKEITLRRSFFEYMRWWDPTAEGRALRKIMPGWLFVINSIVTLLMFPMFAGMGLGHYIAMRVAPEPDWENTPVVRVGSDDVEN
jgi:hypothetical protein